MLSRGPVPSASLRNDGDRALGVMQQGVGNPAELQTEVAVSSQSADDNQVGTGRCLHEGLVGGAFDRPAMYIDPRMLPQRLA